MLLIPLKHSGLKIPRFKERKFFVASSIKSSLNPSKGGKLFPLGRLERRAFINI